MDMILVIHSLDWMSVNDKQWDTLWISASQASEPSNIFHGPSSLPN